MMKPDFVNQKGWTWFVGVMVCGLFSGCAAGDQLDQLNVFGMSSGFEFACVVGDVTPHEAEVWLKTSKPTEVKVQYTTDPLWQVYGETSFIRTEVDRDSTAQVRLTDLEPNTSYRYRSVIHGEKPGQECHFTTAPSPEDSRPITFVVGGGTRGSFQPYTTMQYMASANPDFFVYLGDTIYADKEPRAMDLPEYWAKYSKNRKGLLKQLFSKTSVYVMWDDHDVAAEFDSGHRLFSVGRQAFLDYWPIRREEKEPTRLYRSFRWGKGAELFLLDCRQYRDPQSRTMLGEAQKAWLLEGLGASTAMFKFILSAVPFSDPGTDTWGGYSRERDEILSFIESKELTGVIFVAGGVNHAGVGELPGSSNYQEFIFGPLGAHLNYSISSKDPRFRYFYEASPNFGKITVHTNKALPSVQVEWFDHANTLLHQVVVEDNHNYAFTPE